MINAREARIVTNEANEPINAILREQKLAKQKENRELEHLRRIERTFKQVYDKISKASADGESSTHIGIKLPVSGEQTSAEVNVRESSLIYEYHTLRDAYEGINKIFYKHFSELGYKIEPFFPDDTIEKICCFTHYGNIAYWKIFW